MSIFGSTFKPYVIRQLEARQALMTSGANTATRSRNVQLYTGGKTAWVKMTSFVNYSDKPNEQPSDKLARKYVLQAGTLLNDGGNNFALRSGIANANGAYGSNLGNRQLGYRPMPGIKSVNVVNKGAYGSLRQTTVKFKAWDKAQLDDLEILYMRPGYPVLVEWGWSMYLDTSVGTDKDYRNESDGKSVALSTSDIEALASKPIVSFDQPTINAFDTAKTQDDLYEDLLRLSHKFSGNYDGMVGIVQNFTWELMTDGSYDCTTVLISIGDTLDSIKMNRPAKINEGSNKNGYKTGFVQLMEDLFVRNVNGPRPNTDTNNYADPLLKTPGLPKANVPVQNSEVQVLNNLQKYIQDVDNIDSYITRLEDFKINSSGKDQGFIPYIQMAYFVAILREGFNFFTEKGAPLLNLELPVYDKGNIYRNKGNGLCLASVDSVSVDPSVCIIKNTQANWLTGKDRGGFDIGAAVGDPKAIAKDFLSPEENTDSSKLGVIGNIYLNMNYLSVKFEDMLNSSKDGEVHVYSFIKAVMDDVSKALGSINDFDIYVDNNRAVIIDKHYTELTSNSNKDNKFKLNVFGNNTIVRNYKILSKIFQSQASMIGIAAGAERLNLGGINSSTQAYFNKGIVNRLNGGLTLDGNPNSSNDTIKQELVELAKSVLDIREYLKGMLTTNAKERHLITDPGSVAAAATILNNIILNVNTDANYRSVIPLSLEVTLDGVSGITVGEVFRLNTDVLPKEYDRKDLGFIVTGIQQNIVNSDWTVSITGYIILLDQGNTDKVDNATTLNKSQKYNLNVAINNELDKERAKWKRYEITYLEFLYFIKYYYENSLLLNINYGAKASDIKFTGISKSSDSVVFYTGKGEAINISERIAILSLPTGLSLLSRYDEYSTVNLYDAYAKPGETKSKYILNPLLKKNGYNPHVKDLLMDVLKNDGNLEQLKINTPQLYEDVLYWVNEIYNRVLPEGVILTDSNANSTVYTSNGNAIKTPSAGLKPQIIPLMYDVNSPVDKPNFTARDAKTLIDVKYSTKIK